VNTEAGASTEVEASIEAEVNSEVGANTEEVEAEEKAEEEAELSTGQRLREEKVKKLLEAMMLELLKNTDCLSTTKKKSMQEMQGRNGIHMTEEVAQAEAMSSTRAAMAEATGELKRMNSDQKVRLSLEKKRLRGLTIREEERNSLRLRKKLRGKSSMKKIERERRRRKKKKRSI